MSLREYAVGVRAVSRVILYCAAHMPDMKALLKKSILRYHQICKNLYVESLGGHDPKCYEFRVLVTRDYTSGKVKIRISKLGLIFRSLMEMPGSRGVQRTRS